MAKTTVKLPDLSARCLTDKRDTFISQSDLVIWLTEVAEAVEAANPISDALPNGIRAIRNTIKGLADEA